MRDLGRRWLTLVLTAALAVAGLAVLESTLLQAPAQAATASDFNPANIISDDVFYDSSTMTVNDIQAFLNSKVPTCRAGYTCLKDYWQATPYESAEPGACSAYGANSHESAALSIYKVANACGINPRSLIVLLEKEQGLVTDDWPVSSQYRSATGYGCPDTAACDTEYYGFFNQLYNAALQFKFYRANPGHFGYVAGRWNTIAWNPDPACGTSSVYIQNQATAGLYDYTPYRPNQAALNNLYGVGDSCSAYGNRNFWRLFTDWFGSTHAPVVDAKLVTYYRSTGGATGPFGNPTSSSVTSSSGTVAQWFQGGLISITSSGQVTTVTGGIADRYQRMSGPTGELGFPVAAEAPVSGGAAQRFEKGGIYWSSATGAVPVDGAIGTLYASMNGPAGELGFPLAPENRPQGSASQAFQRGVVYWTSATGAVSTGGAIGSYYTSSGGPSGALGYPTAAEVRRPAGVSQAYQGGTVYWTSAGGCVMIAPALTSAYASAGGPTGALGYPVATAVVAADGRAAQQFANGWLSLSPGASAQTVLGDIAARYTAMNGPSGELGYATTAQTNLGTSTLSTTGAARQGFQGGTIYASSATGAYPVGGAIGTLYAAMNGPAGELGFPLAAEERVTGGASQKFQHGIIYWSSATGAMPTGGAIGSYYASSGGPTGALGYPTAPEVRSAAGVSQTYQGGTVYWTSTGGCVMVAPALTSAYASAGGPTGALGYPVATAVVAADGRAAQQFANGWLSLSPGASAQTVLGDIAGRYTAMKGPSGELGYATTAQASLESSTFSAAGAARQGFQGGTIYASSATGAYAVGGAIGTLYASMNGPAGELGFPLAAEDRVAGGASQKFQHGVIYWSSATGAVSTGGAIGDLYATKGGSAGELGYPAAPEARTATGASQRFQNGTIYWSSATGAVAAGGGIGNLYRSMEGPAGELGYPVAAEARITSGASQEFQRGRIYWSSATGANATGGGIGSLYASMGAASSRLGYPTGPEVRAPGSAVQTFQGGRITWTSATGTRVSY